jgi:hypothetical protein
LEAVYMSIIFILGFFDFINNVIDMYTASK